MIYKYRFVAVMVIFLWSGFTYGQQDVAGHVLDSNGLALEGATIIARKQNQFVLSDKEGKFVMKSLDGFPLKLEVSYVGFQPQSFLLDAPSLDLKIILEEDNMLGEVIVTSRRRQEEIQAVPIPVSVVSGALLEETQAFNVNRLKELVPTIQLYSSNPRNTTLNIRGLGSTFGLTNDGIDPGVGFYVDGVYYARPAVTALDFIDVDQIEVLRGPLGTLFGKNTTSGAFNITTRRPRFQLDATIESSFGNFGFVQTRGSVTGPLSQKLAARLSFSGTKRDGLLYNVTTQKHTNDLNNLGLRGQLLYVPSEKVEVLVAGDFTRQRPDGYAQVIAGVVETRRASFRQFNQIISDLNYSLPSTNPFDRIIDHDTPWRSGNDLGGVSVNVDADIWGGTLTSTSAWRYWNWDPSNDRDFTGLEALSLSQAPSRHDQWSQEIRYAGDISNNLTGVVGVYALWQDLRSTPYHTEESGIHQWRFIQSNQSPLWGTPGLLEGYGIRTTNSLLSFSGAVFGQLDWKINDKFNLLPGLRWNYDEKQVYFNRQTYGGLQTDDPELLALQRAVYNDQEFEAVVDESNFSGQITLAYRPSQRINTFATFSTSFKPVGINLGGLPREDGRNMLELARIEPEYVIHYEVGVKTNPSSRSTLNLVFHNSDITNFQALVQTPDLSVNRGYLANAEQVRVRGAELDWTYRNNKNFNTFGSIALTDAKYIKFTNAPVPLEEVGGESFKDISGGRLPGVSKWAGSFGVEWSTDAKLSGIEGKFFVGSELFFRSEFSSSPSPSQYLNIDGYALLNARTGFRAPNGFSFFLWSRNLTDTDYFELLLPGAGNAGHYAGVLGDPRTFGITMKFVLEGNHKN
ncbi:TonB-dependent receptor [Indibacter alkaliphilus LW1]|uniref:TonB-dependent receptor n=1 Tax=Indibacter alkaliphilus (strain CCUG 57479 / KCTC 22604 / LW1) TaxID=1189612 RepID=S2DNR3_INDAL|nr:TonB-dependent receptor [Indibacter alkaliphilus]EOZ93566.1 TonB-dependent receptor [Indibacter alkaliphilus LW1]